MEFNSATCTFTFVLMTWFQTDSLVEPHDKGLVLVNCLFISFVFFGIELSNKELANDAQLECCGKFIMLLHWTKQQRVCEWCTTWMLR